MPARKKPANSAQLDIFDRPASSPKKASASSNKKKRTKAPSADGAKRKPKRTAAALRQYTTKKGHIYELRRLYP